MVAELVPLKRPGSLEGVVLEGVVLERLFVVLESTRLEGRELERALRQKLLESALLKRVGLKRSRNPDLEGEVLKRRVLEGSRDGWHGSPLCALRLPSSRGRRSCRGRRPSRYPPWPRCAWSQAAAAA